MEKIDWKKPRWMRDLLRFLPLKSQFVLSGNIRDLQLFSTKDNNIIWHRLEDTLALELKDYGYENILYYNPVEGFTLPKVIGANSKEVLEKLNIPANQKPLQFDIDACTNILWELVNYQKESVVVIVDFASQSVMNPETMVKCEHNGFTRALVSSQQAMAFPRGEPVKAMFNSIIWLTEKEGDLPDWLLIKNPKLRHINIGKPDHISRKFLGGSLLETVPGNLQEDSFNSILNAFVDETEGLLLLDLVSIVDLARAENLEIKKISDAVRHYKTGVIEDPWMKIDRRKISEGEDYFKRKILGQDHAVTHLLDIVKRAITGLGTSKRGGRPRGVVFLAGPTGVGKTELAKTLTELLFGDQRAYIRFDMSEFSAEHSDQRLIGAPPGYVGYDVGGELTNAIREKPFSVVLFDEIEKAHPRILDKFLQVLDDGILTSGRGDQVFFSESFIIFTSNLGIFKTLSDGRRIPNVTSEEDYSEVESKVRQEIEEYFKLELNRPELLNRIGDNIIIFDFIREDIAKRIFSLMIQSYTENIHEQLGIRISLNEKAFFDLQQLAIEDLSNGGRGIRNKLEFHFINPLSRRLFELEPKEGESFIVKNITHGDRQTTLDVIKE